MNGMPEQYHMEERDSTGKVLRRYTQDGRIVFSAQTRSTSNITHISSNWFLPAGFPASVTPDYLSFQVYDAIQSLLGSITGLLASRATLQGVGVGDADASATYAVLLTTTQDAVGKLASIPFAGFVGTALEPEAKRYRLMADLFYDIAIALDCLSPYSTPAFRIAILSLSGALKAICGVAAAGSSSAFNMHFAKTGNVAELAAKNAGQKTAIGLIGMLVGSFFVSHIRTPAAVWLSLFFLCALHLTTNYVAVRCITLRTLNCQRANFAWAAFRDWQQVLTPSEVAKMESIFDAKSLLRDSRGRHLGEFEIGGLESLRDLITTSPGAIPSSFKTISDIFADERYLLWFKASPYPSFRVCLKSGASATDQLKACGHAYDLIHSAEKSGNLQNLDFLEQKGRVESILKALNNEFPGFLEKLRRAEWDLDNASFPVEASTRITLVDPGPA